MARWRLWARGFSSGLAFSGLASEVGLRVGLVSLLGYRCDVEDAVDAPVASEVHRCLTGLPLPSPEESATAPVPHHFANFDSRQNRKGFPTSQPVLLPR